MLGGGKDNSFLYNHFENCDLGIAFDNRGETWQQDDCQRGGS